jgi:DinB superfamily
VDANDVLIDGFSRVPDDLGQVVTGLGPDDLVRQPTPGSNSMAWLVWHIGRVIDASVADLAGREQLYTSEGWAERLGFPADPTDSGYGHTPEQAAAVRIEDLDVAMDYIRAGVAMATERLGSLDAADHDVVIDENWDPPVTEGVRWVSVLGDCLMHIGQAGYARGQLGLW